MTPGCSLIFLFKYYYSSNTYEEYIENEQINSEQLKATRVTPVLDAKITTGENLIYCATVQMAWNKLYNDIVKDTIEISENIEYVGKMNSFLSMQHPISDSDCVVMAGKGRDNIIEKINYELKRKFNISNMLNIKLGDDDLFVYAYLFKSLAFKHVFEKSNMYFEFEKNKKTLVKTFGFDVSKSTNSKLLEDQIELIYYSEPDRQWKKDPRAMLEKLKLNDHCSFIIKLKTKSINDEIIVSTIVPLDSLKTTYAKIEKIILEEKAIKDKKRTLFFSRFYMPIINFDIIHDYKEIRDRTFFKQNKEKIFIKNFVQNIKFIINEKGVILESGAFIRGCSLLLDVDGPFIIYIKERRSNFPYFMAYIANDELLVKEKGIWDYFFN